MIYPTESWNSLLDTLLIPAEGFVNARSDKSSYEVGHRSLVDGNFFLSDIQGYVLEKGKEKSNMRRSLLLREWKDRVSEAVCYRGVPYPTELNVRVREEVYLDKLPNWKFSPRCVVPVKDLEGNVKDIDEVTEFSIPVEVKQVRKSDG